MATRILYWLTVTTEDNIETNAQIKSLSAVRDIEVFDRSWFMT